LTGERGGREFRLLDKLKVKLSSVNLADRKIDFVLADQTETKTKPGRRRRGR
jgi:ribonuclease R